MRTTLATILVLGATISIAAPQASTDHTKHHRSVQSKTNKQKTPVMDMAKCMKDMQASEARLGRLLAKMNATRGADRIDSTTAVVNELVASHRSMMAMCRAMMGSGAMKGMGGMHGMMHSGAKKTKAGGHVRQGSKSAGHHGG